MLREKSIFLKLRRGINSLARLDRAIGIVRKQLAQQLLSAQSRQWDKQVEAVEAAYGALRQLMNNLINRSTNASTLRLH